MAMESRSYVLCWFWTKPLSWWWWLRLNASYIAPAKEYNEIPIRKYHSWYQEIRKSTNHLLQGGHLLSKPWFSEKRETGKSINEILLVSTIKYQGRLLTATKLSKPSIDGGLIFSTLAVIKETKWINLTWTISCSKKKKNIRSIRIQD